MLISKLSTATALLQWNKLHVKFSGRYRVTICQVFSYEVVCLSVPTRRCFLHCNKKKIQLKGTLLHYNIKKKFVIRLHGILILLHLTKNMHYASKRYWEFWCTNSCVCRTYLQPYFPVLHERALVLSPQSKAFCRIYKFSFFFFTLQHANPPLQLTW